MRNLKKSLILSLILLLLLVLSSCSKDTSPAVVSPEIESPSFITLTTEETNLGFTVFEKDGFKLLFPDLFKKHKENIASYGIGDPYDLENPVYSGKVYQFFSDELLEEYYLISTDESLNYDEKKNIIESDVFPKAKSLFAISVLRAPLIDNFDSLNVFTGFDNNEILSNDDELCFVFSTIKSDTTSLSEESAKLYKSLLPEISKLKDSVSTGTPMTTDYALSSIDKLSFKSLDINGSQIDDSILSKADYNLIHLFAVWDDEISVPGLNELKKAEAELKSKGVQTITIMIDVLQAKEGMSEDELEQYNLVNGLVKDLFTANNYNFIAVRNSDELNESIVKYVSSIPTTFLVDKNGKSLGSPLIGASDAGSYINYIESLVPVSEK